MCVKRSGGKAWYCDSFPNTSVLRLLRAWGMDPNTQQGASTLVPTLWKYGKLMNNSHTALAGGTPSEKRAFPSKQIQFSSARNKKLYLLSMTTQARWSSGFTKTFDACFLFELHLEIWMQLLPRRTASGTRTPSRSTERNGEKQEGRQTAHCFPGFFLFLFFVVIFFF